MQAFLARHDVEVVPASSAEVGIAQFFPAGNAHTLRFSAFDAPNDSFFYSRLVELALRRYGTRYGFVDLCTGSAIPILGAIARAEDAISARDLHFRLIDLDPDALAVARENATQLDSGANIATELGSVDDFFSREGGIESEIVCINPPYLPYTSETVPPHLFPVAAGPDGLRFTLPALEAHYGREARLVIEWSTLADPLRVMDLIESRFQVEACIARELTFGKYTTLPEMRTILDARLLTGGAVFRDALPSAQILIGCLLRPLERH